MNLAPTAMALKERVLTGWTLQRLVFLALGAFILTTAVMEQQWIGMLMGAYFASMGLFAFGCAGGACGPASLGMGNKQEPAPVNLENMEIEFEEIKSK